MLVENREIAELIMKISKQYTGNIATRFLRPLFAGILSDIDLSRHIADLTEHSEDFVLQGYHLEDIYRDIMALARFIYLVRRDILPNIRYLANENMTKAGEDRVYRAMAFHNLESNLQILATDLTDLYNKTIQYDKAHAVRGRTVAHKLPQLEEFSRLVVEKQSMR